MGAIKAFFNFALFETEIFENEVSLGVFRLTIANLLVFALIFLATKLLIKYSKRYFKSLDIAEKQLHFEGKEIAVWKLFKQIIWIISIYFCFVSLRINNSAVHLESLLLIEFFRFKTFHIAVYHVFYVTAVIIVSRILIGILKVSLFKRVSKLQKLDKGTEYIYVQLAKYLVYGIAIIIIMRGFGIDLNLFLTSAAFLLVGVGLGLQDLFRDFFAGFVLLFESTVKVGDVIEIINQKEGENLVAVVREINLRTSKVETNDGKMLIIPNSKLTNDTVNNWSFGDALTRFMIPITVHYSADLDQIKKILLECAENHPKLSKKRPPIVRLLKFGNDGYELDLVFWAERTFYVEILKSEIRFEIYREFQKAGIEIPYPQRDLHIVQDSKKEQFPKFEDE